jgi:hypothetical protein
MSKYFTFIYLINSTKIEEIKKSVETDSKQMQELFKNRIIKRYDIPFYVESVFSNNIYLY